MQHTSKIQRWGNSSAIRLPARLMQEVGLYAGAPVTLYTNNDELIIRREQQPEEARISDMIDNEADAIAAVQAVRAAMNEAVTVAEKAIERTESVIEALDAADTGERSWD